MPSRPAAGEDGHESHDSPDGQMMMLSVVEGPTDGLHTRTCSPNPHLSTFTRPLCVQKQCDGTKSVDQGPWAELHAPTLLGETKKLLSLAVLAVSFQGALGDWGKCLNGDHRENYKSCERDVCMHGRDMYPKMQQCRDFPVCWWSHGEKWHGGSR